MAVITHTYNLQTLHGVTTVISELHEPSQIFLQISAVFDCFIQTDIVSFKN